MSGKRKSVLQCLDGLVEWTGIPRLVRRERRMRRFKWWPIVLLLAATAGLALEVVVPRLPSFGLLLMTFIQIASAGLAQLGPMRPKELMLDIDERERSWRTRSNLFAFAAVGVAAWIGILVLGGFALWSGVTGWRVPSPDPPQLTIGYWLLAFGEYLLVLFINLPTLHASWTMPEIIEDEPEPDGRSSFMAPRRR